MPELSRRRFLIASSALAAAGGVWPIARAAEPGVRIVAGTRVIDVGGRAARVLGLADARADAWSFRAGERFAVRLVNDLAEETLIHWHGLTPPAAQDGTPGLSQPPLAPGQGFDYEFPLARPGTYWMHSHHGLQAQRLLAAPLIVRDPAEAGMDEQEVVVLLHDFSFRDPEEILHELMLGGDAYDHAAAEPEPARDHAAMTPLPMAPGAAIDLVPTPTPPAPGCCTVGAASGVHVNDIDFDAYLANDRTLADPEVVRVEPAGRVRLRVINGAAATNFVLDLGALEARVIAVDGHPVVALAGRQFPLVSGQRLDLRLALPEGSGAYPILAQREGDTARTGIILATRGASLRRVDARATTAAATVDLELDRRLAAESPLAPRPADREHVMRLIGDHSFYRWRLELSTGDGKGRLPVRRGERVEVTFSNATSMAHPMHLHGHVFQLVAIDGRRFAGPLRDTVLVPPAAAVTIAFDADNPGDWAFHCHHLYHMAAGMMSTLAYVA